MRKNNLFITSSCLLGALASCYGAFGKNPRPNVILILADDMGIGDIRGLNPDSQIETPRLDEMCNRGIAFTDAHASSALSTPSRYSILTGRYNWRSTKKGGVLGVMSPPMIATGRNTIADMFRACGYTTAAIGKWHLGSRPEYAPNNRGFDYFWGFLGGCIDSYSHFYYWGGPNVHDLWRNGEEIHCEGRFFTEETLREAKEFIRAGDRRQPFFLYWAVNIPHYPLQPKEKWLDYYAGLPDPRRMYAAFVSTFDDYLGELRTFLDAQGLTDDTIIVFQSDNGHSTEVRTFGGGGYCGDYRGGKFSLFEGGIRVPAVISWPGHLPAGEVRDQVAMNIDWFPTLLDLCGLDASGIDVDGASIVPLIRDGAAASPHDVLHFDFERQWAVRRGDWKLICNAIDVLPNDRNKTLEGLYLTNLKIDRTESENLIDRYPEKAQELLALRRAYEASLGKDKE